MSPSPPTELPPRFLSRLAELFSPDERQQVLRAIHGRSGVGFRVNPLQASPQTALEALACAGLTPRALAQVPDGFVVPASERARLSSSLPATRGEIYIQNPSSMLAALILAPQPGERILDLCAAPGSKTLHMAALMRNRGWISAVEPVKQRYHRLRANIHRHGARIVRCYQRDGMRVWRLVGPTFDRVLVDAPCSSEGRFTLHDPNSYAYWSEKKIRQMARKQKKLLYSGLQCLKPGGRLLYCTCTLAPEENEAVVAAALRVFGDTVTIIPINMDAPSRPALRAWAGQEFPPAVWRHCRRILPDGLWGGFFFCLFEKASSLSVNAQAT